MRRHLLGPCLLAALIPVPLTAQVDSRPGVAIFRFENGAIGPDSRDLEGFTVGIQQMLITELRQNSALRVIDRSRLSEVLDELGLAASGNVDERTAAQAGRIVGARYVVTGVFVDIYGDFRMDGHIINVETTEIVNVAQVRGARADFFKLLIDLAEKITADADLPPLPAAVGEARRERKPPPEEGRALYFSALLDLHFGRRERAVEVLSQMAEQFPEMTEEIAELRQQTRGS